MLIILQNKKTQHVRQENTLTMFSKTLSISYKIQTNTQELPAELLPDALRYVNTILDNKLKNNFDNESATIDGVFSVAGKKCIARPPRWHSSRSPLTFAASFCSSTDPCSQVDVDPATDVLFDAIGSCFVVHSDISTSAEQLWTLEALQYQIVSYLRTGVAMKTFDDIFDGNTLTWLGPNLVASPVVLALHGAPSEMTSVQDRIFQRESLVFLSKSDELRQTDSSVDMIIVTSQALATSSERGNLRHRSMLESNILEVNALVLGESIDIETFQDRVVNSFNEDSENAFIRQFDNSNSPFFSSVYLVEASKNVAVAAPTRKPNSILLPRLPYKKYNFINTTYVAIALAAIACSIILMGVLVVVIVKSKQAQAAKKIVKIAVSSDPVPCNVRGPIRVY
jgi:hypothetical protein